MSDLNDTHSRLERIEIKLDMALATQLKHDERFDKHEERLSKHDKWHWIQLGATGLSHGLEHAGALLKALLAVVRF